MKRLILMLVLATTGLFVTAQNVTIQISGTVTELNTGNPVPNHLVHIMSDSLFAPVFIYYNTVYTDSSGYYEDFISIPANSQILFYIATPDCNGAYQWITAVSTNAPIVADFQICTSGSTQCQAMFYAIPDSTMTNMTFQFLDASQGNPIQWLWDFGDGSGSAVQNPVHTYANPGTYTVCLTIGAANACVSTYCLTVVAGFNPPLCQANFFAYNSTPGYTYSFIDQSIGNITNWFWSFGDGTSGTGQYPTHTYNAMGYYQVCLTITGPNCQSTYCDYVMVGGSQFCQADFYYYPDSNMVGNTLQFVDVSIGTPPYGCLWDFGDGTTSTLQNPVHTYAQAGYYYVCLTITDTNCTSTSCDTVVAGFPPIPCGCYISLNANGLTANFLGIAYGGTPPYTYYWQFGDGNVSTVANPVHTYAAAGTYTVTLTVADAAGCTSASTMNITVGNNPSGNIWGQVMAGNFPLDFGTAYLYMGTGGTNAMMMIDSVMIDSAGLYHFYLLNPLPGIYYVKVAPTPGSAFYTTHLPTYYGNTVFWASALPIYPNQATNPYNIQLVPLAGPVQGNGTINGQVTNGGAFVMQSGTPAPNVEVMLLDMSNTPLSMDYSDNQGNFGFSNLGMGTYKVYAEVTGMTTNPAIVTLSTSNPASNNLSVIITPTGVITGLEQIENKTLNLNRLYPNPAVNELRLELHLTHSQQIETAIFDLPGEKVVSASHQLAAGQHLLVISLADLAAGQYLLKLGNADGTVASRKITVIK